MKKEELIENLGRIGHSGTSNFLKSMEENPSVDSTNLIGQFGVGFYSVFMVADRVQVFTKSAEPDSKGYLWRSDGSGKYEIFEAENVTRGTKIVIDLRENADEFANKSNVENIIKKYSNFVGFNIKINGDQANTIKPLWTMNKNNITKEQHKEFYQFISKAYDHPVYTLHYQTDSPVNIRSIFYFPESHSEKFGMGRMEPGVSLYSRKILIQNKPRGLLPEWLRFLRGVVDSEEIPLNISRETIQDSGIIQSLNTILTKRVMKYLDDEARQDPLRYDSWFSEFGSFLKEGICTDFKWKEDLARLLRMESSNTEPGLFTSLDDYIARMPSTQEDVWYLVIPTRSFAESSPYFESFKNKNIEVLFMYTNVDDFVMTNLGEFKQKKLKSIESSMNKPEETPSPVPELQDLVTWLREALSSRISQIKISNRLVNSPAIIVDHESSSYRRMMKFVDPERAPSLPKQVLEINASHPIIQKLDLARDHDPILALAIAEQILDNALVAAGLLDDSRAMLNRLNTIMESALEGASHNHSHHSH